MSQSEVAVDVPAGNSSPGSDVDEKRSENEAVRNIDLLLDIPVTLSMELGRTRLSIQELMQLDAGSVVELQRLADEPLDVLVNGTLVAHGEAVVIDDKFGIRLTDVVSPNERVRRLR